MNSHYTNCWHCTREKSSVQKWNLAFLNLSQWPEETSYHQGRWSTKLKCSKGHKTSVTILPWKCGIGISQQTTAITADSTYMISVAANLLPHPKTKNEHLPDLKNIPPTIKDTKCTSSQMFKSQPTIHIELKKNMHVLNIIDIKYD